MKIYLTKVFDYFNILNFYNIIYPLNSITWSKELKNTIGHQNAIQQLTLDVSQNIIS